MKKDIRFEELGKKEKALLLKAFDFDVDKQGYILSPNRNRIASEETPSQFIKIDEAAFVPGSLNVIEGTPTAISRFIIEHVENSNGQGKLRS